MFQFTHRVTYAECTVGNHTYYARYLDVLEATRGEFFRQLGKTFLEWQELGVIFPVVECHLVYRAPARYDDTLRIELRVMLAKGARLNFSYRVLNQSGLVLMDGETLHFCADLNEKPKRLPED